MVPPPLSRAPALPPVPHSPATPPRPAGSFVPLATTPLNPAPSPCDNQVAQKIKTRTSAQIRSHAQKYFAKLSKERNGGDNSDGDHKGGMWPLKCLHGLCASSAQP